MADPAIQLGNFSYVSSHKHLDKKEPFPTVMVMGIDKQGGLKPIITRDLP